jgi:hypothetical protein
MRSLKKWRQKRSDDRETITTFLGDLMMGLDGKKTHTQYKFYARIASRNRLKLWFWSVFGDKEQRMFSSTVLDRLRKK